MSMSAEDEAYIRAKFLVAQERLGRAIHMHNPARVFGLFSGGHDSLTAVMVAKSHPRFTAAAHINTGIGIEATRIFVRETAAAIGITLLEYKATEHTQASGKPDPQDYDAIVRQYGFPGPAKHASMYVRLKEKQLSRLERDHEIGGRSFHKRRVLYVSGARSQESVRRMGHVQEVQHEGRRIWCAPIHDWSKLDTTLLISWLGLKRNPVVDLIHKSGECLCGAFSEKGELEELNMWDETRPAYNRIKALEAEEIARGRWGWEGRPPKCPKAKIRQPGIMCNSCSK